MEETHTMTRRIAFAAIAASMLVALGACTSGSSNTTTGATQASEAPATTAQSQTKDTKADTDTTKRSTGTTTGRSTGTTSKSSGGGGFSGNLTSEQEQCIQDAVVGNPELAQLMTGAQSSNLTAQQAGAVGALLVKCVGKQEVVTGLTDSLKNDDIGKDLSSSELQCVKEQLLALDSEDLAVFVGILIVAGQADDKSIIAPQISKLNSACDTKMAA
jgi:hypothetical protein